MPELRVRALDLLLEASNSGRFIDELLGAEINDVPPRDRALLRELTYGVLRRQNTLAALLNFHMRAPLERQLPEMQWTLLLACYQIIYLSRVPTHAAVFQTLEALKKRGGNKKAVGFANAVLHKVANDVHRKSSEAPLDADDPACIPIRDGYCYCSRPVLPLVRMDLRGHIALKYSYPEWLVERWLERFGEAETRLLCAKGNETPRVTARITPRAPSHAAVLESLDADGFVVEAAEIANAVHLARGNLTECKALESGWIQIQDQTAIQIGEAAKPSANARVLDLCAAPGGKAMQVLERLDGGSLLALDRSADRLAVVESNLAKVGGDYRVQQAPGDPRKLELDETFSWVIVDAPCSNTGVLARRPEARWRLKKGDLESLGDLQIRLLDAAYRHLKPNGRILYSTCSIEPEENEAAVARFIARRPDVSELETRCFLPHRTAGDGGYYSVMMKG